MDSLAPVPTRGAVRVTWSPPTDLCGLTNPQYTIQYGKSKSTPTTHSSMPSSSTFNITGQEVGQEYSVRVAVHAQSGSGTFGSWESVTTYEGVGATPLCFNRMAHFCYFLSVFRLFRNYVQRSVYSKGCTCLKVYSLQSHLYPFVHVVCFWWHLIHFLRHYYCLYTIIAHLISLSLLAPSLCT